MAKRWTTAVWFQCIHSFFTAFYHSFLLFTIFYFALSCCSFHRSDRNTDEQEYNSEVSDPHSNVDEVFGHDTISFCNTEDGGNNISRSLSKCLIVELDFPHSEANKNLTQV